MTNCSHCENKITYIHSADIRLFVEDFDGKNMENEIREAIKQTLRNAGYTEHRLIDPNELIYGKNSRYYSYVKNAYNQEIYNLLFDKCLGLIKSCGEKDEDNCFKLRENFKSLFGGSIDTKSGLGKIHVSIIKKSVEE